MKKFLTLALVKENKVFHYLRPTNETWTDRTLPPPKESIQETIIDCSDLSNVYEFANEIPKHAGHHYCSTAVEWKVRESTLNLLHCDQYLKYTSSSLSYSPTSIPNLLQWQLLIDQVESW